jgi:transcriptional regulator with XRE-family HTH domain
VTDSDITRFYRSLGQAIRRVRRKASVTQAALGEAVGLSRTSITNLERGRQHIPTHILIAIGRSLNTDPRELLPSASELKLAAELDVAVADNDPDLSEWVRSVVKSKAI